MYPSPWSLAVHHQSLAFRARLCHAKNEAPEEEAGGPQCLYEFYLILILFLRITMICKLSYSLKGVFSASLGWIKTRQLCPKRGMVNGKFSAKLSIMNSTLSCSRK